MTAARPTLLQLNPFADFLEAGLDERFSVVRWFEIPEARRPAWLEAHGAEVQAIASGAHMGCPNALMESLPALKIISINGVGLDKVDVSFARARGVEVATTVGGPTIDTADLAVGLIIALLREIPAADRHVRSGQWPQSERPLARKVSGRRFGIVGLGQIGRAVAERLAAFGPVAYTGPSRKDAPYKYTPELSTLARDSDVIVITCPANADTRHMIDAAVLDALGPDGWLVNVARGPIVDEAALIAALKAGRIAGAGLDVFEDEPNVPEALREHPRTVLVPHMGSATVESRRRMAEMVLENLDAVFAPES
jgi:lactate dehydrogenase-like 2-hydroxyacid dehydrogenase